MKLDNIIPWAAGLFEGEGTFSFEKNKAKCISLTSTDEDVIERLRENFGGKIYSPTIRKTHWKKSYVWVLNKEEAITFVKQIEPYLLKRRKERCAEWLQSYENREKRFYTSIKKVQIIKMFINGATHQQIAERVSLTRSAISYNLKRWGYSKTAIAA